MELSLNEVEALAQKAARGGGLAWGLADDAGRSARWLAAHGAGWARGLLALLDRPPPPDANPLRLGCYLADSLAASGAIALPHVVAPAWLLPPLVLAAAQRGVAVALQFGAMEMAWPLATASVPWSEIFALETAPIRVSFGGAVAGLPFALARAAGRPDLPLDLMTRLQAYAAHTYVPASEQSRARGAGSATRDDD